MTPPAFVPFAGAGGPGAADLDAMLVSAARQGASDIILQARAPVIAERHGRAWPAFADGRRFGEAALAAAIDHLYGRSAIAQLAAGADLNCSHAARGPDGALHRFRVNVTPVQVGGAVTANVVIRALPHSLPQRILQELPDDLAAALTAARGLCIVSGVPGSGKSTLLAGVIRHLAEAAIGRIQTYEAPIEFTYDELGAAAARVSQTEIPTHLRDFATGVRSSLRRSPAAILVGEARGRATVEAVADAADFGIATYTTTHAGGVANTVRRLLGEFTGAERDSRALSLLEALNAIVAQMLAPAADGGRVAVREWLVFSDAMKEELADLPHARWSQRILAWLRRDGRTLGHAAAAAVADGGAAPQLLRRLGDRQ